MEKLTKVAKMSNKMTKKMQPWGTGNFDRGCQIRGIEAEARLQEPKEGVGCEEMEPHFLETLLKVWV